ncbi:MAG: FkbM family methyltransferase [Actinomycetota bacterium]|nr:FkbM family methyltransferase [Actinomycetota bacterium]
MALDEILPPDTAIDMVKIDVQGCDHLVIRGMERTLTGWHPSVLVEFWPEGIAELGGDPADAISYYQDLGYAPSILGVPEIAPGSAQELADLALQSEHRYANLPLIPR